MDELAEGRDALSALDAQLNAVQRLDGDVLSVGSRPSLNSERRMLDQVPRDTRLHYRQGSPLGLTLEELDDRGLLDGGGSVPNYYTSSRQRNRRPLEMKKRSSRLQDRGKETTSKLINALFHMIRTLAKRGLPIESFCRSRDTTGRGLIDKKAFTSMLRGIGLPFMPKDLAEIATRYTVPSSDMVDYETLLKDAGVLGGDLEGEGLDGQENLRGTDISEYTGVLVDVKRMLLESMQSLGKQKEDVYRMFAQWDADGTGTVTATQFLRVLARLHVDLTDQDQDLVVELLDINAKGRTDFISLMTFCFAETASLGSPAQLQPGHADDATNGETLSAVSAEALRDEQRSVGSGNGNNNNNNNNYSNSSSNNSNNNNSSSRRPHTATSTRPVAPDNLSYQGRSSFGGGDDRDQGSSRGRGGSSSSGGGNSHGGGGSNSKGQRPLTASARVSTSQHEQNGPTKQRGQGEGSAIARRGGSALDVRLPDDVIDDDDDLMLLTPHSLAYNRTGRYDDIYSGDVGRGGDQNGYGTNEANDGASFNDNTLVTDHDDFFGSPQGNLTTINSRDMWNSQSLDGLTSSQDNQPFVRDHSDRASQPQWARPHGGIRGSLVSLEDPVMEPNEHLALLASQTLATVREMVISRHRVGKTLEEIYLHFDRRNQGFFDSLDFIQATLDLRIETSERVAQLAIQQIALDGGDNVSLGEFKVFINDPNHFELEEKVQLQMAKLLEKQGRKFQKRLYNIFWEEEEAYRGQKTQAAQTGLVSCDAFLSAFQMLGVRLSEHELDRLIARFDINGNSSCSVTRFLHMAQSSSAWQVAEKNLAIQEEAYEEANTLRHQISETGIVSMPEELIAMAEYLGIRVISEQHMLWIARDALKAPLPINWAAQRDAKGRVFFYNHLTNQSRWDHPSDPHFRDLRDKCRRGEKEGEHGLTSIPGTISFGGVGASISPPPLNINVLAAGGPRPIFNPPSSSESGFRQQGIHARPNSAGALLGHGPATRYTGGGVGGIAGAYSSSAVDAATGYLSGSRLPPASGAVSGTGTGTGTGLGGKAPAVLSMAHERASGRPRPQSALPERLNEFPSSGAGGHLARRGNVGAKGNFVVSGYDKGEDNIGGVLWRDDRVPSADRSPPLGSGEFVYSLNHHPSKGMTLTHAPGNAAHYRPSSAPNYDTFFGGTGLGQPRSKAGGGFGKSDLLLAALPGAEKKYTAEGIYRAPYFDLGHFKKTSDHDGGTNYNHSRPKKVAAQRSRDGGGSNMSNTKKSQNRAQSAVDRAVNYGKDIPSYLQPKAQDPRDRERDRFEKAEQQKRDEMASNRKLAAMYDDSFVHNRLGSFFPKPAPNSISHN